MIYYVISIQKTDSGNAQSIFAYETRDEALTAYHSTLASNYVSTALNEFCTMLINDHGGTECREYWKKPIDDDN